MSTIAQYNGCYVIVHDQVLDKPLIAILAKQALNTTTGHLMYTNTYTMEMTDTVCLIVPGLVKKTQTQGMNVSVLKISTEIPVINSVMTVLMSITMLVTGAMRMNVYDAQRRI